MMADETTFFFESSPRVIVVGDAHGDLERMTRVLRSIGVLGPNLEWVAEPRNTVVVQLGDQLDSADRTGARGADGAEGWEKAYDAELMLFMDRLDQTARRAGGRVISLLGNHELMNVLQDFSYVSAKSMERSGGAELRGARFAPGGSWARVLARRPVVCRIGTLLFCHGGLLPWHLVACRGDLQALNRVTHKWLVGGPGALSADEAFLLNSCVVGQDGVLWTRSYLQMASFAPEQMEGTIGKVLEELGATAVLVGHNTVEHIQPVLDGRLWFVDAQFSRSYGAPTAEVLEVLDHGKAFRTLTIVPAGAAAPQEA